MPTLVFRLLLNSLHGFAAFADFSLTDVMQQ